MANLQEVLIDTMTKDLEELKSLAPSKALRKECSLMQKRIESAMKVLSTNKEFSEKLIVLQNELETLRKT